MAQLVIAHVALLVRDYNEAVEFFTEKLRFEVLEDTAMGSDKRWVLVAPPGASGASILLASAATEEQLRLVGNQTAGRRPFLAALRVFLFPQIPTRFMPTSS